MQSNTILKGTSLIAGQAILGLDKAVHGINPATNEVLEPGYLGCSKAHVDQAVDAAWQAFDLYRALDIEKRASFL